MEVLGNMKIREKIYVSVYIEDSCRYKREVSDKMLQVVAEDYPDYTLEGICLDGLEVEYNEEYEVLERTGYVEYLLSREVDFENGVNVDFDAMLYSFGDDDCDYRVKKFYKFG